MSDGLSRDVRLLVGERAGHCCEYCLTPLAYSSDSFSIEHIVPKARQGSDDLENLAYSCQGCNSRKSIATEVPDSVSGDLVPLYNPRLHRWNEHFV